MEFNKTEPQLLSNLIDKAKTIGESEQKRFRRLNERAKEISKILDEFKFCKTLPLSITGGIGGTWYVMVGAAYVVAPSGFGGAIYYKVDADMKPIRDSDESSIKRKSQVLMMLLETKCIRLLHNELSTKGNGGCIFVDGPLMDPWWFFDKEYVSNRARAIKENISSKIITLGVVKRIRSGFFLHEIRNIVDQNLLGDL
jgi:hypothetical protein